VDHRRNIRNSHSRQHITKASQEHKQLCLKLFIKPQKLIYISQ
jgi:hypothetical protein